MTESSQQLETPRTRVSCLVFPAPRSSSSTAQHSTAPSPSFHAPHELRDVRVMTVHFLFVELRFRFSGDQPWSTRVECLVFQPAPPKGPRLELSSVMNTGRLFVRLFVRQYIASFIETGLDYACMYGMHVVSISTNKHPTSRPHHPPMSCHRILQHIDAANDHTSHPCSNKTCKSP